MARLLAPQVRTLIIVARRQDRLEDLKALYWIRTLH